MRITFVPVGGEDYRYWQVTDRKVRKRINQLIDDITRDDPFSGIGKPEPLRHHLSVYGPARSRTSIDSSTRCMATIW